MVFPNNKNGFAKKISTLFKNIMFYYDDDKMNSSSNNNNNNNNNDNKIVSASSPTTSSSSSTSSLSSSLPGLTENEIRPLSDNCINYETKTQEESSNLIIMGHPSDNDTATTTTTTTTTEKSKNFNNINDPNIVVNNIESCANETLTKNNIIILKNKFNDYFIDEQHQNQKIINNKVNNKRNNNDIHNEHIVVDNNNESHHILYEYDQEQHLKLQQENDCESIILHKMDKSLINTTTTPLSSTSSCSSSSSSSSLEFISEIENKKVEPLKINLNRDHLKTVIKKQPQIEHHHSPKITIKPIKPPQSQLQNLLLMESGAEGGGTTGSLSGTVGGGGATDKSLQMTNTTMTPQIIPKIHIRNISDNSSSSSSALEPHIVPKLTIRSVAPQPVAASVSSSSSRSSCSSSSSSSSIVSNSDGEISHSVVPKLTIRMDNHSSGSYCSSFNDQDKDCINFPSSTTTITTSSSITTNDVVPKIHIKAIVNDEQNMLTNDGIRLTIKPIPEPPLPKLTIKTSPMKINLSDLSSSISTTTTTNIVCNNYSPKLYDSSVVGQQTSPIPKITIKSIAKGEPTVKNNRTITDGIVVPKLTIKPIIYKKNDQDEENDLALQPSLPQIHHSHQQMNQQQQSIPILKLKIPKESDIVPADQQHSPYSPNKLSSSKDSSSNVSVASSASSPTVSPTSGAAMSSHKAESNIKLKPINEPLEILTASTTVTSGQDSPRIILKINKNHNNETMQSEIIQTNASSTFKNQNDLKRSFVVASNSTTNSPNVMSTSNSTNSPNPDSESKKQKLDCSIVKNSDKVSVDNEVFSTKINNEIELEKEKLKEPTKLEESKTNLKGILTRLTRRFKEENLKINNPPEVASETNHKQSLVNDVINLANEESSSDCMIIDDPPNLEEDYAHLMNTENNENHLLHVPEDESNSEQNAITSLRDEISVDGATSDTKNLETPVKRGRGRPRKVVPVEIEEVIVIPDEEIKLVEPEEPEQMELQEELPIITPKGRGRGRGRAKRSVDIVKDAKMVQITQNDTFDDDDSPTFSINNRPRGGRGGGGGLRGRGRKTPRTPRGGAIRSRGGFTSSPEKSRDSIFSTPQTEGKEHNRRKPLMKELSTPALQVFEEDTRMSSGEIFQTPFRNDSEFVTEESQSSYMSNTSGTLEGRKRGKADVSDLNGRLEFTVDMLAEYEWPQSLNSLYPKIHDTYMIQEQIAEYLGVKSFKRKYPDLMRRAVEMEERNFIMESALASEKMCDLGLTAVYASEILDIMCNDYPEKYDEYKKYHREKQFREFLNRQKIMKSEPIDKSQLQKDKAIQSAASFNKRFNKDRRENRQGCMDLQNYVIQVPSINQQVKNNNSVEESNSITTTSTTSYPIALVPGQYSEYFRTYKPEELACYPINTVLIDPVKFRDVMSMKNNYSPSSSESESSDSDSDDDDNNSSGSSSSDSSDDSSDSSSSSSENEENLTIDSSKFKTPAADSLTPFDKNICRVCNNVQNKNMENRPECFIKCSSCRRRAHPSCIDMSPRMAKRAQEYLWQCTECKSCTKCKQTTNEDRMLFCDQCDRGYHIYCIGLRNVPEGRWHCDICSICTNCGTKNPDGHPNPLLTQQQKQNLAMISHWTHEYRTNHVTKLREHYATLCIPCARMKNS